MAYSQLPERTSSDINSASDVNTLQDNIEALKGGVGATAPTTTIEDLSSDKADKVSSPTAGNLAGLDANGNLTDSGVAPADKAAVSHTHDDRYYTEGEVNSALAGKMDDIAAFSKTGDHGATRDLGWCHVYRYYATVNVYADQTQELPLPNFNTSWQVIGAIGVVYDPGSTSNYCIANGSVTSTVMIEMYVNNSQSKAYINFGSAFANVSWNDAIVKLTIFYIP